MTSKPATRLFYSLFFLAGLTPASVNAVDEESFLSGKIAEEVVAHAVDTANKLLPQGQLRDGSSPAPVTPAEERQGVIPREDARRIVNSAADAALTEHCELDWRNLSYRPLMRRERQRDIWSDRQLAFIGILHGYVQGAYRELLKTHQRCNNEHKQAIVEFFSRKR